MLLAVGVAGANAQNRMSKHAAEKAAAEALRTQLELQKVEALKSWKEKVVTTGPYKMKFDYKTFGQAPKDGRSLYISMHGGGGVPTAFNDQQWKNQINLYKPAEGIYLAPRSPTDSWNQWHQAHVDSLFQQIIRYSIIAENVNPDKIYLLGYSAGGDGTYQVAMRMADYFAAAAAMAGHPGDARPENFYNLPFAVFAGGKDADYNRNGLAAVWKQKLDSLQAASPKGYVHQVTIYQEMPHWMQRKDTVAIPWLAGYRRKSLPEKLVWIQDDVPVKQFYWLSVPEGKAKPGARTVVSISNNVINIEENQNPELIILLNDKLVNLDKSITIKYKGNEIAEEKIQRSKALIERTAQRLDPSLIFSAAIRIENNEFRGSAK